MARWELWLVAAAALFCHVGVFYLQALRCELQVRPVPTATSLAGDGELRVLVVSDVHLLGKRRRSWIERAWVDWQVHMAARAAVDVHAPEVVLVLGDQLDEGGRGTSDSDWEEYTSRFLGVFSSFLPLKTLYLVGNHDTSFGRFMRVEDLKRYELTFGPSNRVDMIGGHAFVSLNSMALDSDVSDKAVQTEARSFLEGIDFDTLRARTDGHVILLTHVPLFRVDDLQCGEERTQEAGHITYEAPEFRYETHHHVLSPKLSAELLAKVRPDLVLSGHTHAWCAYQHPGGATKEYTIPAFSWGQRPDPSYALLRLRTGGAGEQPHEAETAEITACHLPWEPLVFGVYGSAAILVLLRMLLSLCRRVLATRRHKPKDA